MILEVERLSISYGAKQVIQDLSFSLNKGEVLCIVGESGSGKTTVLRAIMGCLPLHGRIDKGVICCDGQNITNETKQQRQERCGTQRALIFQDSGSMLNPIRTIGTQFLDYIRCHDKKITKAKAKELGLSLLRKVQLGDVEKIWQEYPFTLSGGQRQRVGIAMALAFHPPLLLADEPTSALDVTTQAQIITLLENLKREYTMSYVIVTHNIGLAAYIGDRIMVMKEGKIVELGTSYDLIHHPQQEYTKALLRAVPVLGGIPYV